MLIRVRFAKINDEKLMIEGNYAIFLVSSCYSTLCKIYIDIHWGMFVFFCCFFYYVEQPCWAELPKLLNVQNVLYDFLDEKKEEKKKKKEINYGTLGKASFYIKGLLCL